MKNDHDTLEEDGFKKSNFQTEIILWFEKWRDSTRNLVPPSKNMQNHCSSDFQSRGTKSKIGHLHKIICIKQKRK